MKLKYKSFTQPVGCMLVTTVHCSLSQLTFLLWYFKGISNLKCPKWNSWFTSSVSYSSPSLLCHSTWFYWPPKCSRTFRSYSWPLTFPNSSLPNDSPSLSILTQKCIWNSFTSLHHHYSHLDKTTTTTIANVYWCFLSPSYILTHYNSVRRWILSGMLWNGQKRSLVVLSVECWHCLTDLRGGRLCN